jgi:nucleotide-binding universal stress UspA family protein
LEAVVSFRNILIAIDDSPVAARAAEVGYAPARAPKAEMALAHVDAVPVSCGTEIGVQPTELTDDAADEGRRVVADVRARLSLAAPAREFLAVGAAAAEIVKAARDWPADPIVIGSHGRGGVRRALLGSVADGVMREAPCPVMAVRSTG